MAKFNEYDIRRYDFTKDLAFGEAGEGVVKDFLSSLSNGDFEVKTDRYRNGRMVVETHQNPRRLQDNGKPVWQPSGINVTTAKWFIYQYNLDGAFHCIPTDRLKRYLRINSDKFNESTKRIFAEKSDNPAMGWLLYPEDILDLLTNEKYDNPERNDK